jgi:opacity protein-like surface antigen
MRFPRTLTAAWLLLLLPSFAQASDQEGLAEEEAAVAESRLKWRIAVNGAATLGSLSFSQSRSFTQFVEEGDMATDYSGDAAPGFDLGIQFLFSEHFGVQASASRFTRDGAASYTANLPHPLYFDADRQVAGDLTSLSYGEKAGHLDVVYATGRGKLELTFFGGLSLFSVEADLLEPVRFRHSYPFDSVTVTNVPTTTLDDTAVGFNLGASVDYRLATHFALGAQLRFSRATAKLVPEGGSAVEIDAGGVQAGLGVRIPF